MLYILYLDEAVIIAFYNISSPDSKKGLYPLLDKIGLALFPGVFKLVLSRVKNIKALSLTVTEIPEVGNSIYLHFHKISAAINPYLPKYH